MVGFFINKNVFFFFFAIRLFAVCFCANEVQTYIYDFVLATCMLRFLFYIFDFKLPI